MQAHPKTGDCFGVRVQNLLLGGLNLSDRDRVVWTEGMFLRPQHYQQQVRYIETVVDSRCSSTAPYAWGLVDVELDADLMLQGKVALKKAIGNFPDGTSFSIPDRDEPPLVLDVPVNIKEAIVFICLPVKKTGIMNVDYEGDSDSLARYSASEIEVIDDSSVGGGSAPMQVAKLRTQLKLEVDHLDDYNCIGLVKITEVRADKSLSLDETFIPPVLDCKASRVLRAFLTELSGLLAHRASALSGRVTGSGKGGAAEIADFMLLQLVNRYLPLIPHFEAMSGLHPESLYRLMIALAGEMSTFSSSERRPAEFGEYIHHDLATSFRPVFDTLRQSLSMVLEQSAVPIPLQERKYGIRVGVLADSSLLSSSTFVLAVSSSMEADSLRQRFPSQIKIGPVEQIRQLVNVQLPGIKLRPLPVAPRQVPYHAGYIYFELDKSGELWPQFKDSGGFAIHVGGEFPDLVLEFWAVRA